MIYLVDLVGRVLGGMFSEKFQGAIRRGYWLLHFVGESCMAFDVYPDVMCFSDIG